MARAPLFIGTTTERERATRAAIVRLGIGATLLGATGLGRILFGIPKDQDNGAVRLVARLFAVRQLALGAWVLAAQDQGEGERKVCYQVNALTDAVDIVALGWAGISGKGLIQAAVLGSILGASEVLAWLDLLDGLKPAEAVAA